MKRRTVSLVVYAIIQVIKIAAVVAAIYAAFHLMRNFFRWINAPF